MRLALRIRRSPFALTRAPWISVSCGAARHQGRRAWFAVALSIDLKCMAAHRTRGKRRHRSALLTISRHTPIGQARSARRRAREPSDAINPFYQTDESTECSAASRACPFSMGSAHRPLARARDDEGGCFGQRHVDFRTRRSISRTSLRCARGSRSRSAGGTARPAPRSFRDPRCAWTQRHPRNGRSIGAAIGTGGLSMLGTTLLIKPRGWSGRARCAWERDLGAPRLGERDLSSGDIPGVRVEDLPRPFRH